MVSQRGQVAHGHQVALYMSSLIERGFSIMRLSLIGNLNDSPERILGCLPDGKASRGARRLIMQGKVGLKARKGVVLPV
ncbi:hypothetical protein TNCV_4584181 [Trichonephila clavipes]|nr:hypothetical protein TNCV_4584181 [Trichonephila clavipes]